MIHYSLVLFFVKVICPSLIWPLWQYGPCMRLLSSRSVLCYVVIVVIVRLRL